MLRSLGSLGSFWKPCGLASAKLGSTRLCSALLDSRMLVGWSAGRLVGSSLWLVCASSPASTGSMEFGRVRRRLIFIGATVALDSIRLRSIQLASTGFHCMRLESSRGDEQALTRLRDTGQTREGAGELAGSSGSSCSSCSPLGLVGARTALAVAAQVIYRSRQQIQAILMQLG